MTLVRAAEDRLSSNALKNDIIPEDKPIVFEKLWLAVSEETQSNQGSLANVVGRGPTHRGSQ